MVRGSKQTITPLSHSGTVSPVSVKRGGWKQSWPLHFMLLPAVVLTIVYHYGPMLGIMIAFQDFHPAKGFLHSPWVGLKHFEYILKLPDMPRVIRNTLFISLMKIVFGLLVPIVVSLLLNEVSRTFFKRLFQTIVYLPHFLSWVILGGLLIDILSPSSGIVNQGMQMLGIKPVYFLGSNHWFPYVMVISEVWKDFGFSTIVFLAALTSINSSLYEAAEIDGAGRWKQTWHITLPGMAPIIVLVTTLSLGSVLNAGFDQVYNLYSPQVYESGDIIDTLVFRIGLIEAQYSLATAIGLSKAFISMLLISTSYLLAYRLANYRIF